MMLADRGWPEWTVLVSTLVGGTLAAGAANVFNCYFDRDIDRLMQRTQKRPLVTGEVTLPTAGTFALDEVGGAVAATLTDGRQGKVLLRP